MKKNNQSYNQIVKSTSIFGGSQIVTILIGIVRTKIIAILLGTTGVGLIGIYQSIIEMIRTTSALGMDTGGVKEIATAEEAEDKTVLQKSVSVLTGWFTTTALIGALICVAFCFPISLWAFDDVSYALPIAALSVCVFFTMLATGRSVILQGMRKISFMAKAMVSGSLLGLIITLPLYFLFGLDAIIPSLIINSLILYLYAEFYYRKLGIKTVRLEGKEVYKRGLNTLRLSLFIVISTIIGTVSMFAIRAFIAKEMDIDHAGLFQSVWTITTIYLALILRSMGSDFFPRLSKITQDKGEVKKLVNEQTYIVSIIIAPMVIGMLIFADLILSILYSSDFTGASGILRWMVLGSFIKVLGWPISFILLAKNKGKMFLCSEVIFYGIYLISIYLLFPAYGLDATGIGYLIAYLIYFPILFIMGRKASGFGWNSDNVKIAVVNLVLIGLACAAVMLSEIFYQYISGGTILVLSVLYSFWKLQKVFTLDDLRGWFRKE